MLLIFVLLTAIFPYPVKGSAYMEGIDHKKQRTAENKKNNGRLGQKGNTEYCSDPQYKILKDHAEVAPQFDAAIMYALFMVPIHVFSKVTSTGHSHSIRIP